ncbi:MAG: SEC-C domain-containing protein [Algicola sp.]|nr:SEC-C domain-containing protein [Algicola sp.]
MDDFLKSNIDLLINKQERLIKKHEIIKRFGAVNRNDPCQSGLKFKKCHGY